MLVIIDAKQAAPRATRQVQRLNRRKIMNRQDTIDGPAEEKVGPNRGNEAFWDNKRDA